MPLAFRSLSHGDVAFGFFNIEIDMILLNNYFFFASDMANHIVELTSRAPDQSCTMDWDVYILEESQIGSLMGAMRGTDFRGFIGEMFRRFPFPAEREKFRQHPEGHLNRKLAENTIKSYASPTKIKVVAHLPDRTISIGEYLFNKRVFGELLTYLWVGGYPRWMGGVRPDYIMKMKECVEHSIYPMLGFKF